MFVICEECKHEHAHKFVDNGYIIRFCPKCNWRDIHKSYSPKPTVTLEFPDESTRDSFMSWLSDGGGEYAYMEASRYHDIPPINNLDYSRAFRAWGYDKLKDGEPVIKCEHIEEEDD